MCCHIGGIAIPNIHKIVVVCILMPLVFSSFSVAYQPQHQSSTILEKKEDFTYSIFFSEEDLAFGQLFEFDTIRLTEGIITTTAGAPAIPYQQLRIALPKDIQVTEVLLVGQQQTQLPGRYRLAPIQPPRHLSDQEGEWVDPDPLYYQTTNLYPEKNIELIGQSDLAGQSWVVVNLYPLHYQPQSQTLYLTTEITFKLVVNNGYDCGDYLPLQTTQEECLRLEQLIQEMVINPEDISLEHDEEMSLGRGVPPGDYDYVIITQESWIDDFESLSEWKTKKGVAATIVTTSWIYSEYSGTNSQKIRTFIQDARSTWGTTYFLLGGDTNVIPYDLTYLLGDNIPNDTFYADYDDDWVCEVHVGRAPVRTTGQITTFIDKILTYEKNPPLNNYAQTACFLGFDLCEYGSGEGEDCKQYIDSQYLPGSWTLRQEYDSEGGTHKTDSINYLNQGNNLVNHVDHSGTHFMGTGYTNHDQGLDNEDMEDLVNGDYQSILYTIGCWPANYPEETCIAEAFIQNSNGGGLGFVGNSRYGWYMPYHYDEVSLRYDIYFFRSLFQQQQYHLGECFSDHKNEAYYSDDYMKYSFTELTLLGDPELPIWTENPSTISVSHPVSLPIGPSDFLVETNCPYASICLWKDDEVYKTATANSAGDYSFSIAPETFGTLLVTVTNHNNLPYEGIVEVDGEQAFTLDIEIDGDGMIEIDPDWETYPVDT